MNIDRDPPPLVRWWHRLACDLRSGRGCRRKPDLLRGLENLAPGGALEDLISALHPLLAAHLPCDRVALAFLDPFGNVIAESAFSAMPRVHLDPGFSAVLSETTLPQVAEGGEARIIGDLARHHDRVHRSRATRLILQEGLLSSITAPLYIQGRCLGFLFVSSREPYAYRDRDAQLVMDVAARLRERFYYSYLLQQVLAQSAEGFVALAQKKDNETSEHIIRMSRYSYLIAKQLLSGGYPVTPKFVREILWFSPMHDIGKIAIPDAILTKPGALDETEWEIMKSHVEEGESVVEAMNRSISASFSGDLLKTAREIVAGHHERWDGRGYPRGLAGEDIPLAGRIVAVADVFDALTTARPYKKAFPLDAALEMMSREEGAQFDPRIFAAFLEALPAITEVYRELQGTDDP
ncbi:hypothetical protein AU468_10160 [Alkalispirochaeta sphaeroplastigenens]|uniref:HD-GYP domain-containing protein n=1 Tax=Alkalispirochaeta sphaeroplastigenens TaxID=1187066 RepID=A0A2S4JJE2_9SPIO|nr:HD domain-containing phosphohydrolase [Alkalispirochaeta sphaeroplastigenens]POQ99664.1 hypothetical protein AU468_10160 [Alkalispirochaeta sphaeroplastigenens]